MSKTSQFQKGNVYVTVTNELLTEGWDIVSVKVDGQNALKRKGEFATEEEAKAAAFKIAENFKPGN